MMAFVEGVGETGFPCRLGVEGRDLQMNGHPVSPPSVAPRAQNCTLFCCR